MRLLAQIYSNTLDLTAVSSCFYCSGVVQVVIPSTNYTTHCEHILLTTLQIHSNTLDLAAVSPFFYKLLSSGKVERVSTVVRLSVSD